MSDKTPVKVYSECETKVCRLCSQSKEYERSTKIFSKAGEKKELPRKISYVLGIRVDDDDGFPSNICRNCETKLGNFYEFKVGVIERQAEFRQNIKLKRCKALSPSSEPQQKIPAITPRTKSKARSLFPVETTSSETVNSTDENEVSIPYNYRSEMHITVRHLFLVMFLIGSFRCAIE